MLSGNILIGGSEIKSDDQANWNGKKLASNIKTRQLCVMEGEKCYHEQLSIEPCCTKLLCVGTFAEDIEEDGLIYTMLYGYCTN